MKRSKFSLSHYKLTTMDMGILVPVSCFEVLPGDSIQQSTSALIRTTPLLSPVMHPVHVSIRHFFVPNRLIWDGWEDFITGGPDGMNADQPPYILTASTMNNVGQLADYLGVPPGTVGVPVSALPFRAYQFIYNEFYRDQDLEPEVTISKGSGQDTTTQWGAQRVNWEKDYFTSARPWEQKGPSITVPLGTRAPVKGLGVLGNVANKASTLVAYETDGNAQPVGTRVWDLSVPANWQVRDKTQTAGNSGTAGHYPEIWADLSQASAVTVNTLREAMALQRYEEARARFGSRYTEYLRYLGVRSSDARLQRPEYLGGGRQTIQFSEVLATAEGTDTDVGDLKGHGIASMRSNRYRRFFEEHGLVLTLMHVRPKTIYMQGLSRMWSRNTKYDYWQKEIEHVGQQEIANKEVYINHSARDATFGFQDRYDEYRRQESQITGQFREPAMNHWHFGRDFASDPALNASFVTCTPTERVFAENTNNVLQVMAHNSIQARRMVAKTGTSFIF